MRLIARRIQFNWNRPLAETVPGFEASAIFGMGVVIDAVSSAGAATQLYSLDAFRLAFLIPVGVLAFGVIGLLIARRRTRQRMFELEGIQIAPLWVALFRTHRKRRPPAAGE